MSLSDLTRGELLERARELETEVEEVEAEAESARNATLDLANGLTEDLRQAQQLFAELFGTHATETSDERLDRLREMLHAMDEKVSRLRA